MFDNLDPQFEKDVDSDGGKFLKFSDGPRNIALVGTPIFTRRRFVAKQPMYDPSGDPCMIANAYDMDSGTMNILSASKTLIAALKKIHREEGGIKGKVIHVALNGMKYSARVVRQLNEHEIETIKGTKQYDLGKEVDWLRSTNPASDEIPF